jgi:hypothetical protein
MGLRPMPNTSASPSVSDVGVGVLRSRQLADELSGGRGSEILPHAEGITG